MYKKINIILAFLSFFIPLILYLMTMAPTTSFWDCGEFIATSYILGVPHPPGSPLFLLLGNFFSSLPTFTDIGARVNLISPIASALSVMFLYLIIVKLIEEYSGKANNASRIIINNLSAFVASLTFAVTDSHWFNAVETEVYSLSTFFTAIVIWMILKWSSLSNEKWNTRYLLLIAYMMGLAIGIHILNLLTMSFIGLIIYFKKYEDVSVISIIKVLFFTTLGFVTIYYGIILGLPDIVSKFNSLYIIMFGITIIITSIILIHLTTHNNSLFNLTRIFSTLSIIFIVFLSFNKLFIKDKNFITNNLSNQIVAIDDAYYYYMIELEKQSPNYADINYDYLDQLKKDKAILIKNQKMFDKQSDDMSFLSLLLWQSKSVIFALLLILIGIPSFVFRYFTQHREEKNLLIIKVLLSCFLLIVIGYSTYTTIFIRANQEPRINENNPNTLDRAVSYINREQYGSINSFNPKSAIQNSTGGHWKRWTTDKENPSLKEQFSFMWNYQIKEMYLRYFAWQFIGRSDKNTDKAWLINDIDGNPIGNRVLDGIDFFRYGLPMVFLFGIIGIFAHFSADWKRALAVLSVFLATGLMLVIYLNQYDPQPRERDYSYVGSFFAFSIWVGIGISFIQKKIKDFFEDSNISSFISFSVICFIFISMTFTMVIKDYKDHSRRGNYVAWDYGYNLLNSCEPNAIIFTNGDNDTFPLWYLQEVEKIRRDVRVVNLSLLNTPWYIDQLIKDDPKLNIKFSNSLLKEDIYNIENEYIISTEEGYKLCSNEFTGKVPWSNLDCNLKIDENIEFKFQVPAYRQQVLRIQDYMILQLIKDLYLERPIYFAATVSENNQVGLKRYLQMEGMTYKLVSEKLPDNIVESINYEKMKLNLAEGDLKDIIFNEDDYNNATNEKVGIYRYRNLSDSTIVFSDNIKRLVQNYRIGYLRLMQYQIDKNNSKEVELLIDRLNDYFPVETLPMDPWLGFELMDKIYEPTNNYNEIEKMINHLIKNNSDINIRLLSILKLHDVFKSGAKTDDLITSNFINNMDLRHRLALLDEISRKIESLEQVPIQFMLQLLEDSLYYTFNEKLILYQSITQVISKVNFDPFINEKYAGLIKNLLVEHYDNDLKDVDYQKFLSDNLSILISKNEFIQFSKPYIIDNQRIEGMLYTYINLIIAELEQGNSSAIDDALNTLNTWIEFDPGNQRLINKQKIFESKILPN